MLKRLLRNSALFLLLVLLFASCEHKELYFGETTEVRVEFDWSHIPEEFRPTEMNVLFYPIDHSHDPYTIIVPTTGGSAYVPLGNYVVLSYNADGDAVMARGISNYETLEVYTETYTRGNYFRGITALDETDQPLVDAPNFVCSSLNGNVKVGAYTHSIVLEPEPSVYRINFKVRGVHGLDFVTGVRGLLSGVSGSLFLYDYRPADAPSIVQFYGQANYEDYVLEGSFYIFDLIPRMDEGAKQEFTVIVDTRKGSYYGTLDVSDYFRELSNTRTRTRTRTSKKASEATFDFDIDINLDLTMDLDVSGQSSSSGIETDVDTYQNNQSVLIVL